VTFGVRSKGLDFNRILSTTRWRCKTHATDIERLLARQKETAAQRAASLKKFEEKMKAAQAEMEAMAEARQDKSDAETSHEQFHQGIKCHMEALLEGLKSCGKSATICKVASVACPDNSKPGPERMEDAVVTFERSLDRMEATNVVATSEKTEATVVGQELFIQEMNIDNIGSLEDRYGDRCLAVRRRRGAKKRIQDSVGSRQKSSAARK
jgi:hypothetical protein